MADLDYTLDKLKQDLVGSCPKCRGTGYTVKQTCECLIEFRARHRLILGGFSPELLKQDFSAVGKSIIINKGSEDLGLYVKNPATVLDSGLCLYIASRRAGVGKTTLSHIVVKEIAKYFSREENYRRGVTYQFMEVGQFFDLALRSKSDPLYKEFAVSWSSDIFVLDDLGNEDRTQRWTQEYTKKMLQDFFRHRTRKRLPLILTSNVVPVDLEVMYDQYILSLLEISPAGDLGGLLFRSVLLEGEDFRGRKELSPWPKGA